MKQESRHLPSLALGFLLILSAASTAFVISTAPVSSDAIMQEDDNAPIWDTLRSLGLSQSQWADLLTSDADGNGRTDFLDLVVATSSAAGGPSIQIELLAHASPEALAAIIDAYDGVAIHDQGAAFLTVSLADLDDLEAQGATDLVWMPRAYSNAGPGYPLAQHTIHNAPTAWNTLGYNGSGVRIAILDSGIDDGHDAMAGKVLDWEDCIFDDGLNQATPHDPFGHGSHVASIAAGDDGTDFRGMAWGADLAGARVLNNLGSGTLAAFQCGIDFVLDLYWTDGQPTVASASLGLGVPPLGLTTLNGGQFDVFGFDRAAERLPQAGVPFTVSAGNHLGTVVEITDVGDTTQVGVNGVNQVASPGFATLVITVGALTDYEAVASFSALGPGKLEDGELQIKPDISAHGFSSWGATSGTASGYFQQSGTSMAAPGAAGIVALLLQKDPSLSPGAIKDALHQGATKAYLIYGLADEPFHPNFSSGYGVAQAAGSLALV